jgi:hypothetical protein
VLSGSNAWAVGCAKCFSATFATLIERWNGSAWKQVPSPNPLGAGNLLAGVAATSAANAWAVGYTSAQQAFILRWNGAAWK